MSIAKITDGAVAQYPYGLSDAQADHPNTSFMFPLVALADFGMVEVVAADQPAADEGCKVIEGTPALVDGAWTQTWTQVALTADQIAAARNALADEIDNAVAAVYDRFTRFAQEYETREQQAKDYKNAGYSGTVPRQVQAFATPAGKTATQAADIIIAQATQLRGALDDLGALRMRKYEVLGAASDAAARTAHAEILAAVAAIDGALT